jgi:hypothetical protein
VITKWFKKKKNPISAAYAKRTIVYNYSHLDDAQAVALCSELLLKPDLVTGNYDHPKRVTIEYVGCYNFNTFNVTGGAK